VDKRSRDVAELRRREIHVWVSSEEWNRVRALAQARGISAGELVRRLIQALARYHPGKS
jgi:hypothetical protein